MTIKKTDGNNIFHTKVKLYMAKTTTIPIWKDIYYTGATETLDYTVEVDGVTIYSGKAHLMPGKSNVKINISKICKDYLSNAINDGNIIIDEDFTFGSFDAIKTFELYDGEGTLLEEYRFRYDWSYTDDEPEIGSLITNPINGHSDSRMVPVGTTLYDDEYYETVPEPTLYQTGYCGDYALYYLQRNGAYASFLIEGNAKKTDNYQKYSYNRSFDNNKAEFEELTYHNQISTDWSLSTGWLTDAQADNLAFNLLASNRVWLHDLKNDKVMPVVISESSAEYKTFKNQGRQMVKYSINLTESQNKQLL